MAAGTIGLVIGKFLPPHRGHGLLVETALAQADRTLLVVCEKETDPIPAGVRVALLGELHPGAEIVVTPDDIPDHDEVARAHEISRAWAQRVGALSVARYGRAPDVVFSSEQYGPRFAGYLGARHVAVDPARTRIPISGTEVRADPFAAWDYLEPCVRAVYVRRICVLGAESTGTTTLARELADRLGCPWVPEYGRAYCDELAARLGSYEIDWTTEDFVRIAQGQLAAEDAAARSGARLIVCDTDALATSVWHERYLGRHSAEVERLAAGRRYDHHLLTGDEIPFEQDGTRDGEHVRGWMTGRFRELLAARPEPWLELRGGREQRLEAALAAVRPLLPSGSGVRS
jgi:NadR type nicotinamide-nucleotide adenylyltransferase